ncbi:MAG: carboxypeptidase-like regulatory domain-containing protein, partial [Acidobacteriota bacterium]
MAMMGRWLTLVLCAMGLVLILSSKNLLYAQAGSTSASIVGVVSDSQGAVIGGALVKLKNISTNNERETNTNESGKYLLTQLPPGAYEIRVELAGFKPSLSRIDLELGVNQRIDIKLEVGATDEVVEVVASSLVEEGQTTSSNNVDSQFIDSLPINQRNFLDFSLTSPRVTISRAPAQGITSDSGLSFNAQTARGNNLNIDGLDNNENSVGAVRTTFS